MSVFRYIGSLLRRRKYGYRVDPLDQRDRFFRELGAPEAVGYPESASLLKTPLLIKDQSRTSSCPGQALAQGVRIAYSVGNTAPCPDLSALFIYYNARQEDARGMADDGCTLRGAIKSVQKFGVCPESKWPMSLLKVNKMPKWAAYRGAHDRRGLRGYYRIDPNDIAAVKAAIASKRPVLGGWQVNERFLQYTGGVMTALAPPFLGGHALVLMAYTPTYFRFINSYGTLYGEGGYGDVDQSFVRQAQDLWAIDV
jgi:hypothetical protein